jgi:glycosyltransferase involved in cell wall biosynthesis
MRNVFVLHGTYGTDTAWGAGGVPYGCTFIRLLLPLSHPAVAKNVRLTHGPELQGSPDLVIIERDGREGTTIQTAEELVRTLRSKKVPFLHTLDDNLLDLDARDLPKERLFEIRRVVSFFAREAVGLLVSTPPLAQRMSRLNPNVAVVRNHLDERLFGKAFEREVRDSLTIGYMGTRTHERDFRAVLRGLREVLARRKGKVRLEILGAAPAERLHPLLEGVDLGLLDAGVEDAYPRFVPWMKRNCRWDVAIAPLLDTPLNRAKSDIKFLDYALLGVPGVYSEESVYSSAVISGETGLLAPTTPDGFRDALERLLDDPALRDRISRAAHQRVASSRTLAIGAHLWIEAIEQLLDPKRPLATREGRWA